MSYPTLTPEREKELIDSVARIIVDSDMGDFLKIIVKTWGISDAMGMMTFVTTYPVITGLLGAPGQGFMELMGLSPVKNSQRILKRVEELEEEKRREEERRRAAGEVPERQSFFSSFSKKFSSLTKRKKES